MTTERTQLRGLGADLVACLFVNVIP